MDICQGVRIEPGAFFFLECGTPSISRRWKNPTSGGKARDQVLLSGCHGGEQFFCELGAIASPAMEQNGCVSV